MDEQVKKNIGSVLGSLQKMLASDKIISSELKQLSNSLMEDASLFQDKDSISVAVLTYSLYRIFNRNKELDKKPLKKLLDKAVLNLDNPVVFRQSMRKMFTLIKKYDDCLTCQIMGTVHFANLKKALKIYEHGPSLGQAAEIIGVSKWELVDLLRTNEVLDTDIHKRIDSKTRLAFARGLFK